MSPIRAARLLLLIVLLIGLPGSATANETGPKEVVAQFHAALLDVWRQSDTLSVEQRIDRLREPVRSTFDAAAMMRVATGSAWRNADESQRQRLADAFLSYTTSVYVSRFTDYAGQSFRTLGVRQGTSGRVIVETAIVRSDGSAVSLDYVLHPVDSGWQVIDIVAEGVSELGVLRSDYRQTLRRGGINALIDALNDLADTLVES